MATLDEGIYVIVNVNCGKAIDVVGDANNSNVQIWGLHYGDGQIWAVTKPEGDSGNYQLIASLSGKSMAVDSAADYQNVKQYDDNDNLNTQRWDIREVSGASYSVSGTSYQVYTIRIAGRTTLGLDVEYHGTTDGSNIALHGIVPTANQEWVFVPVPVLSESGFYKIGIANDTTLRCGIASESTADGETLNVVADSDSNTQIFMAERDSESGAFYFIATHSNKVLDWDGDTDSEDRFVYQSTKISDYNTQLWLPTQSGSVEYEGTRYPRFRIRSSEGHNKDMSIYPKGNYSDKHVYINNRINDNANQLFFFIKTEGYGNDISMPGTIRETMFSRNGSGSITVGDLSFASRETKFQARYKVKKFKKDKSVYDETAWMNVQDDSTSRFGWGTVFVPTFTSNSTSGIVTFTFNKTVSLDATWQSAEIYVEVRTYKEDYKNSYPAFGASARSTLYLSQIPTISLSSINIKENDYGKLGINVSLADSLDAGCQMLRGRILGSDGRHITDWVSSASMDLFYPFDTLVESVPTSNETITIEYTMLTVDGASTRGEFTTTFSITVIDNDSSLSIDYLTDGSYTAQVSSTSYSKEYCYMEVVDVDESSLKSCSMIGITSGSSKWKIIPPLNKTTKVIKIDSSNGNSWTIRTKNVEIESHFSIWNWNDNFALLLVNTEKQPQQTRTFSTSISFSSPSGRKHPVGFATPSIVTDFGVSGVVVDSDAEIVFNGVYPPHATLEYIMKLITLSGRGVHPIYRTPYGDWYTVGIESVDVSKLELSYSKVDVKQRVVED